MPTGIVVSTCEVEIFAHLSFDEVLSTVLINRHRRNLLLIHPLPDILYSTALKALIRLHSLSGATLQPARFLHFIDIEPGGIGLNIQQGCPIQHVYV